VKQKQKNRSKTREDRNRSKKERRIKINYFVAFLVVLAGHRPQGKEEEKKFG
jgi:hypothetical protein